MLVCVYIVAHIEECDFATQIHNIQTFLLLFEYMPQFFSPLFMVDLGYKVYVKFPPLIYVQPSADTYLPVWFLYDYVFDEVQSNLLIANQKNI